MLIICIPCGYIYEGQEPFESLASAWCCPDCGAYIQNFEVIDEALPEPMSDSPLKKEGH